MTIDIISRASWGVDEVTPILAPLHSVNAIALPTAYVLSFSLIHPYHWLTHNMCLDVLYGISARNELLLYSYYIAAQQAIWRGSGHSVIVPYLLECVRFVELLLVLTYIFSISN
jgi:hypothetical protein